MITENREIKNNVFVDLFSRKENFLSLYNALHGADLKLKDTNIEEKRLSRSIYKGIQNDVSMLINGKLIVLIEHQSTINKNMPLRCLLYVSRLYEALVPVRMRYKRNVQNIPEPEFFILYNGTEDIPAKTELKLSDAWGEKNKENQLELKVKVLNINSSKNLPTVKKCTILEEYSKFIEIVRKYENTQTENCYEFAIKEALSKHILSSYLKSNASEVINMLMVDYDYDEDIAAQREEAREIGHAEGLEAGLKEGLSKGLAEGKAKGLAEGKAKGLAEGLAEGKAEGLAEGKSKGLAEGKAEAILSVVKNMLAAEMKIEDIEKATGLSKNQILEMKKRL